MASAEAIFEAWVNENYGLLYAIAHRKIKRPEDAEDIIQEALAGAWKNLYQYDTSQSFKAWITKILQNKIADFYEVRGPLNGRDGLPEKEPYLADAWRIPPGNYRTGAAAGLDTQMGGGDPNDFDEGGSAIAEITGAEITGEKFGERPFGEILIERLETPAYRTKDDVYEGKSKLYQAVRDAVGSLDSELRAVLELRFRQHGWTFKAIGAQVGCHPSTVRRRIDLACELLRPMLQDAYDEYQKRVRPWRLGKMLPSSE